MCDKWETTPLLTVRKVLWEMMCDWEGVEPDTTVATFSEDNPYGQAFDQIVARVDEKESEEDARIQRQLSICPGCEAELNVVYYEAGGKMVWHEEEKHWENVGSINEHECPECGYDLDYDEVVAMGII
jgi:uncharacterized protein (UPF0212 family)